VVLTEALFFLGFNKPTPPMSDGLLQSFLNGRQGEHISIRDRGLQYGDGCFETVRILANRAILWPAHCARLQSSCAALKLPVDVALLNAEVGQLLATNDAPDAVLKIIVTRGVGGRGYTPPAQCNATRILQLYEYTQVDVATAAKLFLCQHRLATSSVLAGLKHLNRLDQVLASQQVPAEFDEGLCLDQQGYLVEACKSNIMFSVGGKLMTPDLSNCGVQGLMLSRLLDEFSHRGCPVSKATIGPDELDQIEEMLLCNSVLGVWPVASIKTDSNQYSLQSSTMNTMAVQISNEIFANAV
jgi:4-amino-4-deoxychorismate lyase